MRRFLTQPQNRKTERFLFDRFLNWPVSLYINLCKVEIAGLLRKKARIRQNTDI